LGEIVKKVKFMIIGRIEHWNDLLDSTPAMVVAFEWLLENSDKNLPDGKYEIDGDLVFASVQHYSTQPVESGILEAHEKYIDIQVMVRGEELMLYSSVHDLILAEAYDDEKDVAFYETPSDRDLDCEVVSQENFIVFPPGVAHMPGRQSGESSESVAKIVLKIRIDV